MRTPAPRGMCARRFSHSTPGRIAAATMNPRKSRAMTALIFQRASAATTIDRATSVAVAARRAVPLMARGLSPRGETRKPMDERVYLDARRHGVVLVRPLGRALVVALLGAAAFLGGWPVSAAGGAFLCIAAVWAV